MSLQFYIQDATALLRDQAFAFISEPQLVRWINQARRDIAKRTMCIRRLITGQSAFGASSQPNEITVGGFQPGALPDNFPATANTVGNLAAQNPMQTIVGVERYPYQGFFNPVLQAQYAGVKSIVDTIACSINWGGNFRPTLNWMPWDELQAYCRSYSNQTTAYPSVWSVFNDGEFGEIWLFPVPSQSLEIELDVCCMPKDIYSDDDFDAIPEGFREAVKFRAASLAFLTSYRYQEAQAMEQMFAERLGIETVAVDRGKTPSMYYTSF